MTISKRREPARPSVERDGAEPSGSERGADEPTTPTPEGYGTPSEEAQVDAEREAAEREPTEEELDDIDRQLDTGSDVAIDTAPRSFSRPHGQNSDVIDADSDEPQRDVDLVSGSVGDASLFDQPSVEGDPHAPRVIADEMRALDEHEGTSATSPSERAAQKARAREKLRETREKDEPRPRSDKKSA